MISLILNKSEKIFNKNESEVILDKKKVCLYVKNLMKNK